MARKKKAPPAWTPAEEREARRLVVFPVECRHIDPSLHGDGTDCHLAGIGRTEEEARSGAKALEAEDPDHWNSYGVRKGRALADLVLDEGLDLARVYRALARSRNGFVPF